MISALKPISSKLLAVTTIRSVENRRCGVERQQMQAPLVDPDQYIPVTLRIQPQLWPDRVGLIAAAVRIHRFVGLRQIGPI